MIIPENTYVEITSRLYIYSVIKIEKTIRFYRPLIICRDIFIAIGLLESTERISWCRVSRLTIVAT